MVKVQGTSTEQAEAHLQAAMLACPPYSNHPASPHTLALQQLRYMEKQGTYCFEVCEECNGTYERERDQGPEYCRCLGGIL